MTKDMTARELKNINYEIFILLISILAIINWALILWPKVSGVVLNVIIVINVFISLIFIFDLIYRLISASSSVHYLVRNWGWADVLACLPVPQLKIFRIFRVVRVIHLLRGQGGKRIVLEVLFGRAGSVLYFTIFLVITVLEFAAIGIVFAEAGKPSTNIQSASDGLWWAFVTITTVGYGDRFPVTSQGRIIGMIVMTLGVSLFGVLTGFLANAFVTPREENVLLPGEDDDPKQMLAELQQLLNEHDATGRMMRAKLAMLEQSLHTQLTSKED